MALFSCRDADKSILSYYNTLQAFKEVYNLEEKKGWWMPQPAEQGNVHTKKPSLLMNIL